MGGWSNKWKHFETDVAKTNSGMRNDDDALKINKMIGNRRRRFVRDRSRQKNERTKSIFVWVFNRCFRNYLETVWKKNVECNWKRSILYSRVVIVQEMEWNGNIPQRRFLKPILICTSVMTYWSRVMKKSWLMKKNKSSVLMQKSQKNCYIIKRNAHCTAKEKEMETFQDGRHQNKCSDIFEVPGDKREC